MIIIDGSGGNTDVALRFVRECAKEAGLQPPPEKLVDVAEAMEFALANQLCSHVRQMYGEATASRVIDVIERTRKESALPAFDIGFSELAAMGSAPDGIRTIADWLSRDLDQQKEGVRALLMQ